MEDTKLEWGAGDVGGGGSGVLAVTMARTMVGTGLVWVALAVVMFAACAEGLSEAQGRLEAAAQRRAMLNEERSAKIKVMKKPALNFRPAPSELETDEVLEIEDEEPAHVHLFQRIGNLRKEISDAASYAEHHVPGSSKDAAKERAKQEAQRKLEDRRMKRLIKEVLREFDAEREAKAAAQKPVIPEVSATKQKLKKPPQAEAPESPSETQEQPAEDATADEEQNEMSERMARASELRQKLKEKLNQAVMADADEKNAELSAPAAPPVEAVAAAPKVEVPKVMSPPPVKSTLEAKTAAVQAQRKQLINDKRQMFKDRREGK